VNPWQQKPELRALTLRRNSDISPDDFGDDPIFPPCAHSGDTSLSDCRRRPSAGPIHTLSFQFHSVVQIREVILFIRRRVHPTRAPRFEPNRIIQSSFIGILTSRWSRDHGDSRERCSKFQSSKVRADHSPSPPPARYEICKIGPRRPRAFGTIQTPSC